MPAILSDVVTDVAAAVDKLRADDRLVTSADQKLNELEALFEAGRKLQAVAVRRLREIWATDATSEACGRSTKAWLREEMFLPGAEAGRLLRLVRQLGLYPLTEAAFDTGEISMAHVAAIMSGLEALPGHLRPTLEGHLVAFAQFAAPEDIDGFIDELLETLGIDKIADIRRERRYAQRGVDLHQTIHGNRSLAGTLTPEVGQALERALELAGASAGPDDHRTPRQRFHDALGVIANAYLASNGTPSFTGSPRNVMVTMDLATLEEQLHGKLLTMPDGATITAATARRLACDAEIIPAVLGGNGDVLDIGQAGHEFTVATRRAAYLRDQGRCAFPGCQAPVVELHHIVFRRHGGPGSLDNAAWLCSYHHWLVHEGHWTLTRDRVDKSYLWTGPVGQQRIRKLGTA